MKSLSDWYSKHKGYILALAFTFGVISILANAIVTTHLYVIPLEIFAETQIDTTPAALAFDTGVWVALLSYLYYTEIATDELDSI